MMDRPSEDAKLERARSLCNEACWTIALQVRRLKTEEPEDAQFIFRRWADFQFLIVMLRRLRRAANIASFSPAVAAAIAQFDAAIPGLATMRNVGEHIDAYATDDPNRHHKAVERGSIQVSVWGEDHFDWLSYTFNIPSAQEAADRLFVVVRDTAKATPLSDQVGGEGR
jgi:hypothetical protein